MRFSAFVCVQLYVCVCVYMLNEKPSELTDESSQRSLLLLPVAFTLQSCPKIGMKISQ